MNKGFIHIRISRGVRRMSQGRGARLEEVTAQMHR